MDKSQSAKEGIYSMQVETRIYISLLRSSRMATFKSRNKTIPGTS
jgi:hypothetical protein